MKFPAISKQGKRRVRVPQFTGGINLRDNPTQCNDNQLTELVNMWFKDGTLRTRPGLVKLNNINFETELATDAGEYFAEGKAHNISNDEKRLVSIKETKLVYADEAEGQQTAFYAIHFFWCNKEGVEKLPSIKYDYQENNSIYKDLENYFVINQNGTLYCFIKTSLDNVIYKLEKDKTEWEPIPEEDIYVPTIITHCITEGITVVSQNELIADGGVMFEGYNLLSKYYKMVYNTFNHTYGWGPTGEKCVSALYSLLEDVDNDKYKGLKVKAKLKLKKKNNIGKYETVETEHEITLPGNTGNETFEEQKNSVDGLTMGVKGKYLSFYTGDKGSYVQAVFLEKESLEDNLEITAPFTVDETEKGKIFSMTNGEWFGGSSAGLAGGTRLFLCGNTKDTEKSLVMWSGLNNPLYFPENCYFYVGDTSQAVTGFGKQANMLVIFKEDETWYTQYYQNTDITGETLANQSVVDLQASAVFFPLVQINPAIGCPYPDTVQLCRNRLVWLGNGGKVYSLVSDNQYNERNIYAVSEMIERKFNKDNFSKSIAYDWNGYYCLKCGGDMFLMDYNSYGYVYVSSYSKTEDANLRIPWYYWQLPYEDSEEKSDLFILCENELIRASFEKAEGMISCFIFDFESGKGNDVDKYGVSKEIKSKLQTKFFDFEEPNFYKNIATVGLSLGYNGGGEISVTFVTDGGEEQTGLVLEEAVKEREAGFTKSKILSPAISAALRFGLRLECDGDILIDGLTIDYRVTGRAR